MHFETKSQGSTSKHPDRAPFRFLLSVILLITLASALSPNLANAGVMTQEVCYDNAGDPTSADGWTETDGGPWRGGTSLGSVETCADGTGPLGLTLGHDAVTNVNHQLMWTYAAPANTRISAFNLREWWYINWPIGGYGNPNYGNPYAFRSWHDGWALNNFFETPLPPYGGASGGAWKNLSQTDVDYGSLSFFITCADANNPTVGDCMIGSSGWQLSGGTISLRDDTAPSVGQVSGSLTSDGEKQGNVSIAFNASDTGVGVYRAIYTIDGTVAAAEVLDPNGGHCVTGSEPYTFAWAVPCKLSLSALSTFDTTSLADGLHTVDVKVEDAAGNQATVFHDDVVTNNVPEPASIASSQTSSASNDRRNDLTSKESDAGGTKPRIVLKISPRHTANRHKIHWRGRVIGGSLPKRGITLLAQARKRGDWIVFRQIKANAKGQFRFSYRFHATTVATSYTFRVALPRNDRNSLGRVSSNAVRVHVKP
jgi:hypothetical protein